MSTKPSKLWSIALPFSLLILASAYYIKVPAARRAIDARTTLGHQLLGRFVAEPEVIELPAKKTLPGPGPAPFGEGPLHGITFQPAPVEKPAKPEPFNLQKLANDRSLWPRTVILKKAASFPAVINGKVVGSLVAPAGSEANLVAIKDGKVGVEFQGGGAWLVVDDTDLATRAARR